MSSLRKCSRSACTRQAVTTLTYVYADSTAVLGPLAVYAEPHSYDLCNEHAERMTAPLGWEIIRLAAEEEAVQDPSPSHDDLEALANAVREAAQSRSEDARYDESRSAASSGSASSSGSSGSTQRSGKRGHLRVLRDPES